MTENNAAQPGLTDEEILHRWDIYVSDPCAAYPLTDADKIDFARAIESALLSKLRAEGVQADDERAAFEEWDRLFTVYCGAAQGVEAGKAAEALIAFTRAALASAPIATPKRAPVDDGICWSSKEIQRRQKEEDDARAAYYAARASAPVVGEVVAVLRREIGESSWFDHRPVRPGSEEHAAIQTSAEWDYCPVYAAPQASEAVRPNIPPAKPLPDLMMASYHEAIGWNACRAAMLKSAPQADKDGGDCAKGAAKRFHGLVEEVISWLETGGGRADSLCADLRKALAAQKQGDSDE